MAKSTDREALCRELLGFERKLFDDLARMSEIKSLLKADAEGENFQVRIAGLGLVKVSAPRGKSCTGTAPMIVVDKFLELPKSERNDLIKRGIVAEEQQWKNAYYGSVTAELF